MPNENEVSEQKTDEKKLAEIIEMVFDYGSTDGGHHKQWVLDQVLRIALGDTYHQAVKDYNYGDPEDPNDYYHWEVGISP